MRTLNETLSEMDVVARRDYLLEFERADVSQAKFDVLAYFALNDPYAGIRMNCVSGLREFPVEFLKLAGDVLIQALKCDADPQVREVAASSLGSLGISDAVPDLQAALVGDADPDARERAVEALTKIGTTGALQALEGALSREADPGVRFVIGTSRPRDARDAEPNA